MYLDDARARLTVSFWKTGEKETPGTRGQCRIVACFRKKPHAKNPRGYGELRHNALWLIRHLKGERWGLRGDGSACKHNQPCLVGATHLREEQQ